MRIFSGACECGNEAVSYSDIARGISVWPKRNGQFIADAFISFSYVYYFIFLFIHFIVRSLCGYNMETMDHL